MTTPSFDRDVVIVGGGVVGLGIARQLTRHHVDVTLLEARPDVAAGTSKANTAILHTGFDATPGTIESRLVARGHTLLHEYAAQVGIPIEPLGALLVAWNEEQQARFPQIIDQARRNGYDQVREIPVEELRRREPHLGPGALGALEVPDEHIVCPSRRRWPTPTTPSRPGSTCAARARSRRSTGSAPPTASAATASASTPARAS